MFTDYGPASPAARILARVKNGATITQALNDEHLAKWYRKYIDPADKELIRYTRAEFVKNQVAPKKPVDIQARLDRILVQVQAGLNINDALRKERLLRWYYRDTTPAQRAGVRRARFEYVAQHPKAPSNNKASFRAFGFLMPVEQHQKFLARCNDENVTMGYMAKKLINKWLNSPVSESAGVGGD